MKSFIIKRDLRTLLKIMSEEQNQRLKDVRKQIVDLKEQEHEILREIYETVYLLQCDEFDFQGSSRTIHDLGVYSSREIANIYTYVRPIRIGWTSYKYMIVESNSKDIDLSRFNKQPRSYPHISF